MTHADLAQPTSEVAERLVGCLLVVDPGSGREVRARIVETEAYLGSEDPASHAFRGPDGRARVMFGPPGRLYVYVSYGLHHCANVVTEQDGVAGAVLLRAAAIDAGAELVAQRRRDAGAADRPPHRLLTGPGTLCRGLAIGAADNALDLCGGGRIVIEAGEAVRVVRGPRVGITRNVDAPLRFCWADHPSLSRSVKGNGQRGQISVSGTM